MKFMKKGQAALEFLTTYGWAFLVILVMIGALAYFGVLKPSRLLPDRCNIGPEFECIDYQLSDSDDTIKIRLKSNVGEPIKIDSVDVSAESVAGLSCTDKPVISDIWVGGSIKDITFSGCNIGAVGFVAGEKGKVLFNIKYYAVRSGSGYAHNVNGEIFSTVV
tara:strand:- start:3195 stop:3683 length:489 start_codon:yes stop_codon:yes gene_type:complete